MRIAILLTCDETMGGIGIYAQEVVRALLQIDSRNEYLLVYPAFGAARRRRGQFQGYKNAVEIEAKLSRVSVESYWDLLTPATPRILREKMRALIPLETYWDQVAIPRIAREYGADVVFNPHMTVPIRGRFGKVAIMHAVEYHTVPNVYTMRMYLWWYLLEKVILPAADRLISLSDTMTEAVRRHVRYPIAQVRTIYHGVSGKFRVETDSERLERARTKYHLPEHFILFVGRLYPEKNFSTLLRAFGQIAEEIPHQLVVVGEPRYKCRGEMKLLQELGIEDRVDFLDHIPNDDLPMLYNLADCLVNPSLYEAFGLAQLEAMACECPVIAANAGAIPEITGGAAVLFDPLNWEELARATIKVTSDREFRSRLVSRATDRARAFTWERTARQTLEVFQELA